MSECTIHELAFGSPLDVGLATDVHLVRQERAGVADYTCPTCGLKLYVYYRFVSPGGPTVSPEEYERKKEGD